MPKPTGLMHAIVAAHAWAKTHTAPLLFCRAAKPDDVLGVASGVPVRLFERFFLFTAGHVLAGLDENVRLLIGTPMSVDKERVLAERPLAVDVPSWGLMVTSEGPDAGYLELVPKDAETEMRLFRHSVTESHIAVVRGDGAWHDAVVTLSGHPSEKKPTRQAPSVQLLCYTTGVAGIGGGPRMPEPLARHDDERSVVLWIQEKNNASPDHKQAPALAPLLKGMSGGGYWLTSKAGGDALLVATHASSTPASFLVGDDPYRFARGTRVAAHLALIAYHVPALAQRVHERWPELRERSPQGATTTTKLPLGDAIRLRAPRAPRDRARKRATRDGRDKGAPSARRPTDG